ncbi:hypothetical protein ACFW1A_27790 [Kitasatospora sp. NPDC058965]|uniref:hypothetical protein n=1 Tax=Kitasatospora sp. NPDC058965 TaxID=3346682 RepID=UPI003697AA93
MSTPDKRPDAPLDQTVELPAAPLGAPVDQTVELPAAPVAGPVDQTVVLATPPAGVPVDQTVVLSGPPVAVPIDQTVVLSAPPVAVPPAAAPPAAVVPVAPVALAAGALDQTVVLPDPPLNRTSGLDQEESATFLDEEAWPTPGNTAEFRRFGPGVPVPTTTVPEAAAVAWHAEPAEPERRRRSVWLIPLLVLLLVLGYLGWQWWSPALAVTGVSVQTDPAGPACGGVQTVIGTVDTKGGAGTVTYRWLRSDGTVSDSITQAVPRGTHHTQVTLRWTFEGKGTMSATATLVVLSPGSRTASAAFNYSC